MSSEPTPNPPRAFPQILEQYEERKFFLLADGCEIEFVQFRESARINVTGFALQMRHHVLGEMNDNGWAFCTETIVDGETVWLFALKR